MSRKRPLWPIWMTRRSRAIYIHRPFPSCCMIMHDAICIGLHLSAFRECCMCRLLRIHYVVYRNGFDYQVRLLSFRQKRRWQVALNWSQNKTCHNKLSHLLILKGAPLRFSKHASSWQSCFIILCSLSKPQQPWRRNGNSRHQISRPCA